MMLLDKKIVLATYCTYQHQYDQVSVFWFQERVFGRKDSQVKAGKVKDTESAASVGRKGSKGSKDHEVGHRRSLKQVDRRDSKSSSKGLKGQDLLQKRSSEPATSASAILQASTSQPQEKGIEEAAAAPQLSKAMVNNIQMKLNNIRLRQGKSD